MANDKENNDQFLRGANIPKDFNRVNPWFIRQVFRVGQNLIESPGLPRYVFENSPFAETRMSRIFYGFDFKLNRQVVAKKVEADKGYRDLLNRALVVEARTMAGLSHDGIPKFLDLAYHRGAEGISPIFIMKYFAGGTLKDWKDQLGSQGVIGVDLIRIVSQSAEVIHYLASHGIVHKDIKPGNIFDVKPHIQIIDFMTTSTQDESRYFTASPGFSAPEVLRGQRVDVRADIFSLGATVYNLITNRHPYGEGNDEERIRQTLKGQYLPISYEETAYLRLSRRENLLFNHFLARSLAQNKEYRPTSPREFAKYFLHLLNKY